MPRNASTAASAWAALAAWWPVQRQEDVVYGSLGAVEPDSWPPTASCRSSTPNSMPSRWTRAPTSAQRCSSTCAASDRLAGEDGLGAGLDDPGLLVGDLGDRVAEQMGVVDVDRGDHGDVGVGDVGRVPGAAESDLDHRHVDRGVGERRVRHRGDDLEEGHRDAVDLLLVDHRDVGLELPPDLVEALLADRLPVDGDPLGHRTSRAGW